MTNHPAGESSERALDALLAGYAAGSLNAPLHALVAGHLAISGRNRGFVAGLEAANGAFMEGLDPVPLKDRSAALGAILALPAEPKPGPGAATRADPVLPAPLVRYLGSGLDGLRWRTILPGVKGHKVERSARGEAVLFWIKPGRKMPHHTHEGSEYTLVLKGGFTESGGHFRRGDVSVADEAVDHRPVADRDEDCICFAVTDAPLRLTGPIGRVVQRLFGTS